MYIRARLPRVVPGCSARRHRRHSPIRPKFPGSMSAVSSISSSADAALAARVSRADRAFLGHPAGLGWLSFCELWERFSYYGMQALLVLYLSNYLFLPQNIGQVAGIDVLRHVIESVTGPRSP